MSTLSAQLDVYLKIRRGLGFSLRTDERILRRFIDFVALNGSRFLQRDDFAGWMRSVGNASQYTWSRRLGIVKLFAAWMHANDGRHEIPPANLIPHRKCRPKPFIYTSGEIAQLLDQAAMLPSVNGIRRLTYPTLFGLIAVTGLRISEALSLDRADIDFTQEIVIVRNGKSGKQRIVPFSPSTSLRLQSYVRERDRLCEGRPVPFFVDDHGRRISDCAARYNFASISQAVGLRQLQRFQRHGVGPRIHDLRHTFAVQTMIDWYRQGLDANQEMIKLTTMLGHESVSHTYWYIEAIPELLELASRRAELSPERETRS
jgi:integrase/recombinase XerD